MNWKETIQTKITLTPSMMQGEFICRCADVLKIEPMYIVEVGVYEGMTSEVFRSWFPGARLVGVDPWTHQPTEPSRMYKTNSLVDWEHKYKDVCKRFSRDVGTFMLRCHSTLAAVYVPDDIDIIFIDGQHSYEGVISDLEAWTGKMNKPSLITGHDYNHTGRHKGVGKAVDEFFGKGAVWVGPRKTWVYYAE